MSLSSHICTPDDPAWMIVFQMSASEPIGYLVCTSLNTSTEQMVSSLTVISRIQIFFSMATLLRIAEAEGSRVFKSGEQLLNTDQNKHGSFFQIGAGWV